MSEEVKEATESTAEVESGPEAAPAEEPAVAKRGFFGEVYHIMMTNKKWWILPIVIILGLLIGFILLSEQQQVLPYIYAMM